MQFEAPPSNVQGAHVGTDRPITRYSDAFIEAFFQQVVSRHFNAVCVLRGGTTPSNGSSTTMAWEHATDKPADLRKRNFDALSRFYGMARKYGLRTFLHHYVLALHAGLGPITCNWACRRRARALLRSITRPSRSTTATFIVARSRRSPSLDGLYMNFESGGDAVPFMRKTLLAVANSLPKKPVLFFRLWGVTDVEGMKGLLADYTGPKGLIHKSHDTNDVYYYPVADDRVKVWKKAIPGIEFTFSVGPCHNCGTNISQKLWDRPGLRPRPSGQHPGQGGGFDLLPVLPRTAAALAAGCGDFSRPLEHDHARMNSGHLQAIVDYVREEKPFEEGLDPALRRLVRRGREGRRGDPPRRSSSPARSSSSSTGQFCYGSSQGGLPLPSQAQPLPGSLSSTTRCRSTTASARSRTTSAGGPGAIRSTPIKGRAG